MLIWDFKHTMTKKRKYTWGFICMKLINRKCVTTSPTPNHFIQNTMLIKTSISVKRKEGNIPNTIPDIPRSVSREGFSSKCFLFGIIGPAWAVWNSKHYTWHLRLPFAIKVYKKCCKTILGSHIKRYKCVIWKFVPKK